MYSNVGGEIKAWAKFIVILITIMSVIMGGVLGSALLGDYVESIIIGALIGGLLGYFLGRLGAIFVYAFGELVETVVDLREIVRNKSATGQAPAADKQAPPPVDNSAVWYCRICGEKHENGEYMCRKCKTMR